MKKYVLVSIVIFSILPCHATDGYWFQNRFIELSPTTTEECYMQLRSSADQTLDNIEKVEQRLKENGLVTKRLYEGLVIDSKRVPNITGTYVSGIYSTRYADWVIVLPRITLQLKEGWSIESVLQDYSDILTIRKFYDGTYSLHCNCATSEEVLSIAGKLHNHPAVEWSEPAKGSKIMFQNTHYPQQYYLKNTGQTGGTTGMDINVEKAWELVSPQTSVTVAVIDTGVEHIHEDLSGNVLDGYTVGDEWATGGPTIEITSYDSVKAHGTACAGIIAANNNSIGIKGVAYDVPILPVNIAPYTVNNNNSEGFAADDEIADAIRWAYQRADILSCSWICFVESEDIADAIADARTYGRGGKGTIVVFCAGNYYSENPNSVAFPSILDGAISVGALDKDGNVCSYSQRGQGLTLMAFGGIGDIVTTDRMGQYGYSTTGDVNYVSNMDGTSAACPQVSGVVALMLSANPFLTESEVRTILQTTCRQLPGYTYTNGWSNQVGYGLLNAEAAVRASFIAIDGPDIPAASSVYSIVNLPDSCTVTWNWQSDLTLVPSDNPTIVSNHPSSNNCTIINNSKAYLKGYLIATISKGGVTLTSVGKAIDTGKNFTGTYKQEGGNVISVYGSGATTYYPPITEHAFADNTSVFIHREHRVTLKSPLFSTSNVSVSGSIPPILTQNGDSITFYAPLSPPQKCILHIYRG